MTNETISLAGAMAGNIPLPSRDWLEEPPQEFPDYLPVSLWTHLQRAIQMVEPWVKDGVVAIPEIDETAIPISARFTPIFEMRGYIAEGNWTFAGFEIDDLDFFEWVHLYRVSVRAADTLLENLSTQVIFGKPLPKGLADFLALYLRGEIEGPNVPKTKRANTERDTLLAATAKRVSASSGLDLGFSKASYDRKGDTPIKGCTVAAAALHAFGIRISATRAVDIVFKTELPVEMFEKSGFTSRPIVMALMSKGKGEGSEKALDDKARYKTLGLKAAAYFAM